MNIHQLLFFCSLPALCDGNTRVGNTNTFIQTEGRGIIVKCPFDLPGRKKFLCKDDCKEDDVLIETEGDSAQKGRYSILYKEGVFLQSSTDLYVSIAQLIKSDSGRYRCGLERRFLPDVYWEFEVRVTDAPQTVPETTTQPEQPTTEDTAAAATVPSVKVVQLSREHAAHNISYTSSNLIQTSSDLKMSDRDNAIVKNDLQLGTSGELPENFIAGAYAGGGTFVDEYENESGECHHKRGEYAGAGLGQTSLGGVEMKAPNFGAGFETSSEGGGKAIVKAELASASVSAGPAKATVGLSADTGAGISKSHVEAKVLGTGFSFGRKMGISLFGTGFEIDFGKK